MSQTQATRYRASPEVIARKMGDGIVIVHIDTNRIFELNSTASRLWELLLAGSTCAHAQRTLLEEYSVSESQLSEEVQTILAQWRAEKLVIPDERD